MSATRIITDPGGRSRRQVASYHVTVVGPSAAAVPLTVGAVRFRIGSEPGNDLVLADPSVSRYHAEIVADERGHLLRDLGSTNGTAIELAHGGAGGAGQQLRVEAAYLPERARVHLGGATIEIDRADGNHADVPASDHSELAGMVGRSAVMREVFSVVERAAQSDATILVQGESGTGKELVARALHQRSGRAGAELITFDCAAVPSSLIESQLFGHERGAFTGATTARAGVFEEADGGTLFLDEMGELPLELQPKLLRVLESRQVKRLGAARGRAVDVRLVAATNRDLAREVNRGTFRADLYYRLAVVEIALPPLRERPEDVRLLAARFIEQALRSDARRAREVIDGISDANWRRLERLPWPGNVRELRNFIERTLVLSDGPRTENIARMRGPASGPTGDAQPGASDGAHSGGASGASSDPAEVDLDRPFSELKAETIARFERAYLLGQLERADHNVSAAARASGLDRMNFKRLLKKHR